MTRIVLINGVPASGKSTLARRYAEDHPLTLALDIDLVRRMLGGWMDRLEESGLAARRIAVEMARAQLGSGRDVVIPQFLGRLRFVQTLAELCDEVGAEFVEIVLLSSPDEAVDRFIRRTAASPARATARPRPWWSGPAVPMRRSGRCTASCSTWCRPGPPAES